MRSRPELSSAMKLLVGSLAVQLTAFALVLGGLFLGLVSLTQGQAAIAAGLLAAFLAWAVRMDRWWILIHGLFSLAVMLGLNQEIPSIWYLLGFVLLALFYLPAVRSRVPLFLSNQRTIEVLREIVSKNFHQSLQTSTLRLLDFGSGSGSVVSRLAKMIPQGNFVGIEAAVIPSLIATLRTWRQPNARVRHGDFWSINLSDFDVVYAFLSPAPMPRVWEKAVQEMRNGSLLISNSFPVPNQTPDQVVTVSDARQTRLYLYRIKS